ncbi:hypothetical protein V8C26DRAFT_371914 [Trichoderma gracile]
MGARFAAAEANGIGCLGIRFGAGTDGRWACQTDNKRRRGKLVDSSAHANASAGASAGGDAAVMPVRAKSSGKSRGRCQEPVPDGKPRAAAETLPAQKYAVVRMAATLLVAIEPVLCLRQGVGRLVPELVPTPECRYYMACVGRPISGGGRLSELVCRFLVGNACFASPLIRAACTSKYRDGACSHEAKCGGERERRGSAVTRSRHQPGGWAREKQMETDSGRSTNKRQRRSWRDLSASRIGFLFRLLRPLLFSLFLLVISLFFRRPIRFFCLETSSSPFLSPASANKARTG